MMFPEDLFTTDLTVDDDLQQLPEFIETFLRSVDEEGLFDHEVHEFKLRWYALNKHLERGGKLPAAWDWQR